MLALAIVQILSVHKDHPPLADYSSATPQVTCAYTFFQNTFIFTKPYNLELNLNKKYIFKHRKYSHVFKSLIKNYCADLTHRYLFIYLF